MSKTTADWRGIVIEVDNNETQALLEVIDPSNGGVVTAARIGGALTGMGVPAFAAGIVAAAVAAHFAWESQAIKLANKGDGVILTMLYGFPGVAIPSTRFPPDVTQTWVTQRNGTFVSAGGDRIDFLVENNVEDPAIVMFRMINQTPRGWDKSFVLRDGQGSQWEIRSTASAMGRESLWAHQVQNGQMITFRKPSFAGWWIDVINVGGLGNLQPGDRATFTWGQD